LGNGAIRKKGIGETEKDEVGDVTRGNVKGNGGS